MSMAVILANMPDLWQRLLVEHVPDYYGRCRECRSAAGVSAGWPCATRRIAEQARELHEDARSGAHAAGRVRPRVPAPRAPQPVWSQPHW